jgi:hypothetical protein
MSQLAKLVVLSACCSAGAFFLINLALAVLYLQFTKEFSLAPSASAVVTRSASLEAGQASLRLADLQAEPSELQHAQMTADDYDDEFAGLPPYGGGASGKQAALRVDKIQAEGKSVGSGSVRGSTSVGRQARFQDEETEVAAGDEETEVAAGDEETEVAAGDEEAEVAAGDAFVTAEVVLTSRLAAPAAGQQQHSSAPFKSVKQGVHYPDGHQSPRARLQQLQQQQRQQQERQQQDQLQQPGWWVQMGKLCSSAWGGIRQACRTVIEVGA